MAKEIEILWELESSVKDALSILEGHTIGKITKTVDTYYVDPTRDTLQPVDGRLNHALRLRNKNDSEYLFAFKKDYFNDSDVWLYSDEHETRVDSATTMHDILLNLGLEILVTIDMTKHVFVIDNYEVVIEEVNGLGNFIEVEVINPEGITDIETEKENIRSFLGNLGIKFGAEQNAGKPELLLRKNLV